MIEKNIGMQQASKSPEEIIKLYEKDVKKLSDSKLSAFINEILSNKGAVSAEDIIYSDARHEEDLRNQNKTEEYNKTSKSSLHLKDIDGEYVPIGSTITGFINGKKIKIDKMNTGFGGTIDGQKISEEDAKKIFENFFSIAEERTKRIDALKKENLEIKRQKTTAGDVNEILK